MTLHDQLKLIDAAAKDGRYKLVGGPSGYINTPFRFGAARWDAELSCWIDHAGDWFTEGGADATHYMELGNAAGK